MLNEKGKMKVEYLPSTDFLPILIVFHYQASSSLLRRLMGLSLISRICNFADLLEPSLRLCQGYQ